MMWWNHGGWGAGEWLSMSLMMVIFWGAVIVLGVWLVRRNPSTPTTTQQTPLESAPVSDSAERLLGERFARGEIEETEFTRARTLLRTRPANGTPR